MMLRSILDDAPIDAIPRAVVRPRDRTGHLAALRGGAARWLVGRLAWLRPRTLPLLFALGGTLAILATMDRLAQPPRSAEAAPAAHHPVRLTIIVGGH
jgi:hypothetical protein